MPALPKVQPPPPEFISLPQALWWLVRGIKPVPESYLTRASRELPDFPKRDTSCEDLYLNWVNGTLKLYGRHGKNSISYRTPIVTDGIDTIFKDSIISEKFENIDVVPVELICKAGIDGIDWCNSLLSGVDRDVVGDGHFFCWGELCVLWDDIYNLTTTKISERNSGVMAEAVAHTSIQYNEPFCEDTSLPMRRRTGLPGRPSSWDLIEKECRRRWAEGERHLSSRATRSHGQQTSEWGRVLLKWLREQHPLEPQPAPKSVANKLASLLGELSKSNP